MRYNDLVKQTTEGTHRPLPKRPEEPSMMEKIARMEVLGYEPEEMSAKLGVSTGEVVAMLRELHRDPDAGLETLDDIDNMYEGTGGTDTVEMDVPLLIRALEFAREDAKDDMELHSVVERMIAAAQSGAPLNMEDYDRIFGHVEEPVEEGEEMGSYAGLKDWREWNVVVMNNYYRGKYADYGGRYYSVVASSPDEAKQVVLNNADYVLKDLLSRKLQNGKKVLPRGSALPVEAKRIGDVKPGSLTTMGFKKMLTPEGPMALKFSNGQIVGSEEHEVTEAGGRVPSGLTWTGSELKKRPELVAAAKRNKNYQAYLKRKAAKEKAAQEQGIEEAYDTSEGNREYFDNVQEWAHAVQDFGGDVVKARGVYVAHAWEGECGEFDPQTGEGWLVSKVARMNEGAANVPWNAVVEAIIYDQFDTLMGRYGLTFDDIEHMVRQHGFSSTDEVKAEYGQELEEAIPYALSAANANAEYERTKTFVPRGYKGRVDLEVSSQDEYNMVMKALKRAAKYSEQHVECGLSGDTMSVFSKTMDSGLLDEFIDDVLSQGVFEAVSLDRSKNPSYPNDPATLKHRLDTAKAILSDPKSDPDSRRAAAGIVAQLEKTVSESLARIRKNKAV